MAAETAQSSTQQADPRAARMAIMSAARRVLARDGAGSVSFAGVAREAGLPPETISSYFQSAQEILLAVAADDLAQMARAVQPETEAKAEPPREAMRKKIMSPPLEQVMKEVAPDHGKEAMAGPLARLERRVQVLEKAFSDIVDRHEKSLRERAGSLASVEESISAVLGRMDATEKHYTDMMGEMRLAISTVGARLHALEDAKPVAAAPAPEMPPEHDFSSVPAPAPVPEPAAMPEPKLPELKSEPATDEKATDFGDMPAFRTEDRSAPEPNLKLDKDPKTAANETYLAAARRAALKAAETNETSMSANLNASRERRGNRAKFFLFACAAPVVVLGAAFMVMNKNTVTAGPVPPASAIQQSAQAAPAVPPAPPEVSNAVATDPIPGSLTSSASLASLTQAAEAGDVKAARDAGLKYLAGDGVDQNEAEAARWLMRAAYKGEPTAEYWLATLYARGHGVPADAFQANHWYEAAAKQGNRRAMHSLAVANFQGWGMEKNYVEAARWFKAAAELGLVDSEFNLGVVYERGAGVPQSLTEAYKWYAIAAAQGDKEADARLQILASQLKPGDLAIAQSAAASFKPRPMDQTANLTSGPAQLPGG